MSKKISDLDHLLMTGESENLEFKTAADQFSTENLMKYCSALSNQGGGKLVLGVSPDKTIKGTRIWQGSCQKIPHGILQNIHINVNVEEVNHPKGRVVIVHVPAALPGQPVSYKGQYFMRSGESLVRMDNSTLRKLLNENELDFSSQVVDGLSIEDCIDTDVLGVFRRLLVKKSGNTSYYKQSISQLLRDLGLTNKNEVTYACLILLGKKQYVDKYLPDAEIIFEWRSSEEDVAYGFRKSWRDAFIKVFDDIWKTINDRNTKIPFHQDLFQYEILSYDEKSIREALLNAIAHRDYTIRGQSVLIKVSPQKLGIESPGGFLPGVNPDNVLFECKWRNRRLAETLEKIGLIERSGQGMDRIFENTIRAGKGLPDLSKSDRYSVRLYIPAKIKDREFVLYLEKITRERKTTRFSVEDIYELERIREGTQPPLERIRKFVEWGIVDRIGSGKGTKYILSHNYYQHSGKTGLLTRIQGLDRNQKKQLIINHLKSNSKGFFREFQQAFPDLKRSDIANLLSELKHDKKIKHAGNTRTGYWIVARKLRKPKPKK